MRVGYLVNSTAWMGHQLVLPTGQLVNQMELFTRLVSWKANDGGGGGIDSGLLDNSS